MKGYFVLLFATAFFSGTLADLDPLWEIQEEENFSLTSPTTNISGTLAYAGQFPYHVRMAIYKKDLLFGSCGGSIIHVNWVLTAAHCVDTTLLSIPVNILVLKIQAGILNDSDPAEQTVKVFANGVYLSAVFNPNTGMYDIALLKTETPFNITDNVKPIPLVSADTKPTDYVGQFVTISGFGYYNYNGSTYNVLFYTKDFKIIPFEECKEQYEKGPLPTTSYCVQAKASKISITCSGDSGGPVTLITGGQIRLIGVVSYVTHQKCDEHAQGHTDVAQFIGWIHNVTGLMNFAV